MNSQNRIKSFFLSGLLVMMVIYSSMGRTKNYYQSWTPGYVETSYLFMSCIQSGQLSISENGKTKILPQMLMTDKMINPANYKVQIVGTLTDTATCQQIGQKIKVQVIEIATSNYCWTTLLVEDKLAPTITCKDTTVLCTGDLTSLDSLVMIGDNCNPKSMLKISSSEIVKMRECTDDTFAVVTRTWQAIDPWNRKNSCTHTIKLLRPASNQIVFPNDTTIYCPATDISTNALGVPTIEGKPLDKFCGWIVTSKDNEYQKCGNSKKILREWTILDCCSLSDTVVTQFILISDTTKPTIQCPAAATISTSSDLCYAKYLLKNLALGIDSCSGTNLGVWINIDESIMAVPGKYIVLKPGEHTLEYQATDPCGNKSICSTTVTVKDMQAPTLLCPELIQIPLPTESISLAATVFSSVTVFDNCDIVNLKVRKSIDNCADGIDDTQFTDTIHICCEEVNESIDFIFLASDDNTNSDSCTVKIEVVDKLAPELNCTQNDTVTCDRARPAFINPQLTLVDNCLSSVKITIDTLTNVFNLCGIGEIRRRVVAIDPGDNKDTCFQIIKVIQDSVLSAADIFLKPEEDTVKVIGCRANLLAKDSVGYKPPFLEFNPGACNRIFISFVDTAVLAIGTSRCAITRRTWRVGDSCVSLTPLKILKQIIIQDTTAFLVSDIPTVGKIQTVDDKPIEQVIITGQDDKNKIVFNGMSDMTGTFKSSMNTISTFKLRKEVSNALDGISTLDLLRIQQHIVGSKILTSPVDQLAADVDQNGDINILDLIALKKLILGIHDDYSKLTWKFVEKNDYMTRLAPGMSLSNQFYTDLQNKTMQFVGFRLGDVTHDASVGAIQSLEKRENNSNDAVTVLETNEGLSIYFNQSVLTKGFQISIFRKEGWKDVETMDPSSKDIQFHFDGNELRIVFVSGDSQLFGSTSKFLNIRGAHPKTVLQPGLLPSEWYTEDNKAQKLDLKLETMSSDFDVQVFPTPTADVLNLKFNKQYSNNQKSKWVIFDQTGKELYAGVSTQMTQQIQVGNLAAGLYVLQIKNETGWSKKIKFLKN